MKRVESFQQTVLNAVCRVNMEEKRSSEMVLSLEKALPEITEKGTPEE